MRDLDSYLTALGILSDAPWLSSPQVEESRWAKHIWQCGFEINMALDRKPIRMIHSKDLYELKKTTTGGIATHWRWYKDTQREPRGKYQYIVQGVDAIIKQTTNRSLYITLTSSTKLEVKRPECEDIQPAEENSIFVFHFKLLMGGGRGPRAHWTCGVLIK